MSARLHRLDDTSPAVGHSVITRRTRLEDLPQLLTVEELAEFLDIGRGAAYELARDPRLRAVRLGRLVRVPRLALVDLLGGTQ